MESREARQALVEQMTCTIRSCPTFLNSQGCLAAPQEQGKHTLSGVYHLQQR